MNRLLTIKEISNWGPKIRIYLFSGLNITLTWEKKDHLDWRMDRQLGGVITPTLWIKNTYTYVNTYTNTYTDAHTLQSWRGQPYIVTECITIINISINGHNTKILLSQEVTKKCYERNVIIYVIMDSKK